MPELSHILQPFDYKFPAEQIAQAPAHPRDAAKLLVYDRKTKRVQHAVFKDILNFLPKNGVLVLNQTKVVPARLEVTKPTGGKARLLYLSHDSKYITALSDRPLTTGVRIKVSKTVYFDVTKKENQFYKLKPSFKTIRTFKIFDKYGQPPLPPYIKHSPLKGKELKDEYQTVFAKEQGSIAAPTASLHFTRSLLNKIKARGITIRYLTLHVNLGTFAPLTSEQLEKHKLHSEHYHIDVPTAKFLNQAKKDKRPIIAVGTTVVRTLESASNNKGQLTKLSGETSLFLTEKSKINFVNHLITNFHVPKSSLLMLVSAFIGRKQLLKLYEQAIKKKYRLFSFGDAMYIQ